MNRPVSYVVDQIISMLEIKKVKKSHRSIVNTFVRLLYFIDRDLKEFSACPLTEEELAILTTYYYHPRNVIQILMISERTLRSRMAKIRKKLMARNNIEAICIARQNNWIPIKKVVAL